MSSLEDGNYWPSGETVRQFHLSDDFFRVLMGPFGSGKTVGCSLECYKAACLAAPDRNGVRRSRNAIIRNRISDLEATTVKTWNEVFESRFGKVRGAPTGGGFVARWLFGIPEDGTTVDAEFRFFPFDTQRDIKRLLGSEYTSAFLNEVRELPPSLMNVLPGRLRYPKPGILADGYEPKHFIIADTNPPDLGHWLHKAFESDEEPPEGWKLFRQPPGVIKRQGKWVPNPDADNVQNLHRNYYPQAIAGQPEDVIRVNYGNEYGYIKAGKLIVPNFSDHLHVAPERLEFDPNIEVIYVGIDFGSTPAAALLQEDLNGRWYMIEELISLEKPGIRDFGETVLLPRARELEARGHTLVFCGDPAGEGTSQTDGEDCFETLAGLGIDAEPAYTNAIGHRGEVVDSLCRSLSDGVPRFQVSPSCKVTIQGLAQKYVYEQVNEADDPRDIRYRDRPKKDGNAFSHICDGVGYGIMGSGYGEDFLVDRRRSRHGPIEYKRRYNG